MDRRNLLKALAGLAICPVCTTNGFAAEGAHWSYEGAEGPAMGRPRCRQQGLRHRLAAIADRYRGHHQIPAAGAETGVEQDRRYHRQQRPHPLFAEGSTLKLGDTTYKLVQVHFHRPSEHQVGGKNFPMEAHFVHRAD